ncbi:unnamed protein product, partial [Effrenium voratum]
PGRVAGAPGHGELLATALPRAAAGGPGGVGGEGEGRGQLRLSALALRGAQRTERSGAPAL